MNPERPLDGVTSLKVKLGLLVGSSVVAAVLVAGLADRAGVPWWTSVPVTIAAALGVTQWLARGMTSPLREMTAAAARMAAGDYGQRVTATSSDEVGRLARAFTAMAADLAGADVERRRLVATVSHELRTPLAAQRALLENLVDGVAAPDQAALEAALGQAERLSALVEDLLDLSRVDAGVAPLVLASVQVEDLLRRAAEEARVAQRGVRVLPRVEPPGLTVSADAQRLAQLVANLVDNAVRHSPPGGKVGVQARREDEDHWVLEVRDEGPGIPAQDAERVFERFGTGADAAGGTGLGLAIVRWVSDLHGGSVEVVPTPPGGTGAHLRVRLPTAPRADRPGHLLVPTRPTAPDQEDPVPTTAPPTTPAPAAGPAPAPAGPSGPSDDVVERFWPERDGRPRPGVLLASLGIGAFAAATWVDRGIGLATSIVLLAAGGLMWSVARHRSHPWTVACAALAAVLATTATVRDADGVVVLSVLTAVVVAATGMTHAHGVLAMVAGAAAWPLAGLRGLPLLGRTITATSRARLLWPVVRTAAVTLVLLVVFGALFASGDAVFGAWASALVPDLGWDSLVARGFVLVLVGGVTLAGSYLALNPPPVDDLALPPATRARPVWEWAVPVGVVVALFAGFLLAQATAMFGGHEYLRESTGLTYAEYVHQGFGQLTAATALTVLVIATTLRAAGRTSARGRVLTRVLLGLLGVLTLAVVASALYRMDLYQDAYGFTVLRLFVDGVELWLGLVVLLLLTAVVRLSWRGVARTVLVSGAVFTLGFVAMNPDGWVAARNLDRYAETGRVDTLYLSTLSADATPVIAERLPAEVAQCVEAARTRTGERDDWLSWNVGRSRAEDATLGPAAQPGLAPECIGVVTDDYRG
ncbi:DUF4173 domain-containing protein [Phycicoccus endophyticus]|uniref:Signal transduction histidine-protein kinase/phosphatase MprB n=1 Tax=Phycicoccus endophyticus TaxID=1690220 RepID=A0A7G9QZA2_9MICO|nr:DUF4153 domain-containing protein [Phycicoccus endophyticus]NHI19030.1 DUF4173 domain-containing protein [Phycicoccus endophyticus]QNN48677.1 DUF4173 domain-containing protein [Phycicoccus endophyticus]GGL32308.1 hypothetical protein GCM10012283_13280 [Phycicoccus endophyticus]